jgi:hypothetical protein
MPKKQFSFDYKMAVVEEEDGRMIVAACDTGNVQLVMDMISKNPLLMKHENVGYYNETPIAWAVRTGELCVLNYILSILLSVNYPEEKEKRQVFFDAFEQSTGGRVYACGASASGQIDSLVFLMEHSTGGSCILKATGAFELTAVHLAVYFSQQDVLYFILRQVDATNILTGTNWLEPPVNVERDADMIKYLERLKFGILQSSSSSSASMLSLACPP